MRIAVGIPSYREADNIGFITSQVDKGLLLVKKTFPQIRSAAIFNIDNESDDGTRDIFNRTKTVWEKVSLKTTGKPGKGKNVIKFFQEASREKFDILLTLDSDLKSIEPKWILEFIEPFLEDNCDFVCPQYGRNRFEGSTTNHFAYPMIYSFFGKNIRQPIAGDFAFSADLVENILLGELPKEIKGYGIDIFLTIKALLFSDRIKKINLTQKIHKPSFSKLEAMFPQVAASAIQSLENLPLSKFAEAVEGDSSSGINNNTIFSHQNEADCLQKQQISLIRKSIANNHWIGEKAKETVLRRISNNNVYYDGHSWSELLVNWVSYTQDKNIKNKVKYAEELLPYFVLRTVDFWNRVAIHSPEAVEEEIRNQAREMRERLLEKLTKVK